MFTKEVFVQKTRRWENNILLQFLIEAMVIGVVGGTLGVILGIGSSYAISYFAGWQTVISIPTIIIAVVFSVGIGLFFGIYPARKAALLDPIEALRYGAKNEKAVRASVANGILLSVLVTILITVVGLSTMKPLLLLMNTPEDIFADAYTYSMLICSGVVACIFYNLF